MAYSVTSWFQGQIESRSSSPKRQFLIDSTDYSDRVKTWPKIRNQWDEVRPQAITLSLINQDGALNTLLANKINFSKTCAVRLGFTHPTSGDELITMYSGKIDKLRFQGGNVSITLLDKFKQLTERVIGDRDTPVTFTDSTLPSDLAWAAVTSYGGYSAIQSDSNPDINYASFQTWAAVFSADTVYMNGHFEGRKCSEALKRIARYTQSAIYIEDDKIAFQRFSAADSNQSTLNADSLLDVDILVDDADLVNRQYVYGAYNVDSKDWGLQVVDASTTSVNSFGPREQVEKDEAIWYVSSVACLNMAQRVLFFAGDHYEKLNINTTLVGALRQVGETIAVNDGFFAGAIDANYRVMSYTLDLDKGLYSAQVDRSQYANPFTLDVSALDGTDLLL